MTTALLTRLPACSYCGAAAGTACRRRCTGEQLYAHLYGHGLGYLGDTVSPVLVPSHTTTTVTALRLAAGSLVQLVSEAGGLQPASISTPERDRVLARVQGVRKISGKRWLITARIGLDVQAVRLEVAAHGRWLVVSEDAS